MSLVDFLGSTWFRYGIFPVLSASSGILLKCVTRNDSHVFFKKEDMAVGPALMLTASLTFIVITTDRSRLLLQTNSDINKFLSSGVQSNQHTVDLQARASILAEQIAGAGWTILILILVMWATTVLIKRKGWVDASGMNVGYGIASPLVIGVLMLIFVMMQASQ